MECMKSGVHPTPMRGIQAGPDGAYSICLSAGFENNDDNLETFWYRGEGGRKRPKALQNDENGETNVIENVGQKVFTQNLEYIFEKCMGVPYGRYGERTKKIYVVDPPYFFTAPALAPAHIKK
jgi:hypothetical protein